MAFTIETYSYEGTAEVLCKGCESVYEIEFNGDDTTKIKDSIKESMLDLGWIKDVCPICAEESQNDNDDGN
jgi:hypothetical protein